MDDNLSQYELDRIAQMEDNKLKLIDMGIEPLVPKQEKKKKKKKSSAEKREAALPQRRQPSRGNGKRKDYTDAEFFAQHDLMLSDIDEDGKLRRRRVQKIRHPCQRVLKCHHRKSKKPTCKNKASQSIRHTLVHDTSDERPGAFLTNAFNKERLQKLFLFGFTITHLRESGGPQELIDTFQRLCDDNAHIRYLVPMNEGRSQSSCFRPQDVCAVAQAITANEDLSTFDAELVARYNTAVAEFKGHPCKLDLNVKTSTNPLLKCERCKCSFASRNNGDMRDHTCILKI
jgi:hypothetical protein